MNERDQTKAIIADYKMGVIGLGDATERIGAVLGVDEPDIIEDILIESGEDPIEAILDEIDAEYELGAFEGDPYYDDSDDDDQYEEQYEREHGGEA